MSAAPATESKPVYKMEGWSKFRQTPQIKSCDMVLEMETETRDIIVMALDKYLSSGEYESAAVLIKSNMDKKFGGPWNIMVRGFAFSIKRCKSNQRTINRLGKGLDSRWSTKRDK